MGTPKPTASLSSNLLARKGQARPAMRPQGFVGLSPATTHDDLGWNDMGEDAPRPQPLPAPVQVQHPVPKPMVLRQREELDQQIAEPKPEPEAISEPTGDQKSPLAVRQPKAEAQDLAEAPAPVAAPAPARPVAKAMVARAAREAIDKKGKAAFTLRLDHDRHLRLRLASALTNRSAQLLVTEALDAFLDTLTEVDALARQVGSKDRG
ncbi:hypothetical protein IAG41_01725 [Sphingomonas sp. JC676]|nr:hypothetical protein [Sphingomonas sp. JC676]MBC9031101.1 hypothetical protein [Sphingomonas sp. JC676]